MAIFNSYVKSPEGRTHPSRSFFLSCRTKKRLPACPRCAAESSWIRRCSGCSTSVTCRGYDRFFFLPDCCNIFVKCDWMWVDGFSDDFSILGYPLVIRLKPTYVVAFPLPCLITKGSFVCTFVMLVRCLLGIITSYFFPHQNFLGTKIDLQRPTSYITEYIQTRSRYVIVCNDRILM